MTISNLSGMNFEDMGIDGNNKNMKRRNLHDKGLLFSIIYPANRQ